MYFYLYVNFYFTGISVLLLFMYAGRGCMRKPFLYINLPVKVNENISAVATLRLRNALLPTDSLTICIHFLIYIAVLSFWLFIMVYIMFIILPILISQLLRDSSVITHYKWSFSDDVLLFGF